MPFTLIRGTFHVTGFSPDGDSIRFRATNKNQWGKLTRRAKLNAQEMAQLRFEGVDALETHYRGSRQPRTLADAATMYVLSALKIRNVVWGRREVTAADDGTPGYILTRNTDGFGRPVSFVFSGSPPEADGSTVFLHVNRLRQSVNYRLMKHGLVYPTYYATLYYELRSALTDAAVDAWYADAGVWPKDRSSGLTVKGQETIQDDHPILPKLFRRLTEYLGTHSSVIGFKAWLEKKAEKVIVIPLGQATHFDTVIQQKGKRIGLTVYPEDLMFDP